MHAAGIRSPRQPDKTTVLTAEKRQIRRALARPAPHIAILVASER